MANSSTSSVPDISSGAAGVANSTNSTQSISGTDNKEGGTSAAAVASIVGALVSSGGGIVANVLQNQAQADANNQAYGLASLKRQDILGAEYRNYNLQKRQQAFTEEEARLNRLQTREQTGYNRMRDKYTDMINLVNQNAQLRQLMANTTWHGRTRKTPTLGGITYE